MIKIIDYGMGNLKSVDKAFKKLGYQVEVVTDSRNLEDATGVVLPGVGAFKDAMNNLKEAGFINPLTKLIKEGRPFLGICLGLQLLFSSSQEFGTTEGLDIISGQVKKFPADLGYKIPHIGWNNIKQKKDIELYTNIEDESYQYFVHSYYVVPDDKEVIATTTDYGIEFVSSIAKDNIYAVQFHPEKSSEVGLQILDNFAKSAKK